MTTDLEQFHEDLARHRRGLSDRLMTLDGLQYAPGFGVCPTVRFFNTVFVNPVVVCDVDLTVVDTLVPYLQWFKDHSGQNFPIHRGIGEYDWNPIFAEYGVDAHAFWKQTDLYDDLQPVPHCVEFLTNLVRNGATLVFASHCYQEHEKSKHEFLRRFFDHVPFEFASLKAKWLLRYDVLIDDNPAVIGLAAARNSGVHLMRTTTPNIGYDERAAGITRFSCWSDL